MRQASQVKGTTDRPSLRSPIRSPREQFPEAVHVPRKPDTDAQSSHSSSAASPQTLTGSSVRLMEKIRHLTKENEELFSRVEELSREKESLQSEVVQTKDLLDVKGLVTSQKDIEIESLQEQLKLAQQMVDELSKRGGGGLSSIFGAGGGKPQEKVDTAQLIVEVKQKEQYIKNVMATLEMKDKMVQDLRHKLDRLVEDSDREGSMLRRDLKDKEREIRRLENHSSDTCAENATLIKEKNRLGNRLDEVTEENERLQDEIKTCREHLSASDARVIELESALASKQSDNIRLAEKLLELQKTCDYYETTVRVFACTQILGYGNIPVTLMVQHSVQTGSISLTISRWGFTQIVDFSQVTTVSQLSATAKRLRVQTKPLGTLTFEMKDPKEAGECVSALRKFMKLAADQIEDRERLQAQHCIDELDTFFGVFKDDDATPEHKKNKKDKDKGIGSYAEALSVLAQGTPSASSSSAAASASASASASAAAPPESASRFDSRSESAGSHRLGQSIMGDFWHAFRQLASGSISGAERHTQPEPAEAAAHVPSPTATDETVPDQPAGRARREDRRGGGGDGDDGCPPHPVDIMQHAGKGTGTSPRSDVSHTDSETSEVDINVSDPPRAAPSPKPLSPADEEPTRRVTRAGLPALRGSRKAAAAGGWGDGEQHLQDGASSPTSSASPVHRNLPTRASRFMHQQERGAPTSTTQEGSSPSVRSLTSSTVGDGATVTVTARAAGSALLPPLKSVPLPETEIEVDVGSDEEGEGEAEGEGEEGGQEDRQEHETGVAANTLRESQREEEGDMTVIACGAGEGEGERQAAGEEG
ncbi:unnamed protein product [Vitrella brassicaformis CCMP3155]|uniref:Uncharacterized protein n=2 Tax=Vitrella brassicaformis TaxID=1169539 RepID=A0A0G4FCG9_VITBC|nr:unnamed protein product [Vitrella brassicaformis CCMP3155]|eukprot:CEM10428.1 unnamed protein product [Vitrella brassicaformis CCMP3155]